MQVQKGCAKDVEKSLQSENSISLNTKATSQSYLSKLSIDVDRLGSLNKGVDGFEIW